MAKIAVVMGSDSDFDVVKKGLDILKQFEVSCEVRVISAHRTPAEAEEFAVGAARGEDFNAEVRSQRSEVRGLK